MPENRPKIGLALSGGSGKAISYIGIIEVLEENNIPIDYIAACSSGTIIAGSITSIGNNDSLTISPTSVDVATIHGISGGFIYSVTNWQEIF